MCFDTEGFYDDEDDGPHQAGWGRLFAESPDLTSGLNEGNLEPVLEALLVSAGIDLDGRTRVNTRENDRSWLLTIKGDDNTRYYLIASSDGGLTVSQLPSADDETGGTTMVSLPSNSLTWGLDDGQYSPALLALLAARGVKFKDAASRDSR